MKVSSDGDLTNRVRNWVESQGYPLEMYVARKFQQAGFDITVADYYQDVDSGKYREIDVTAIKWSDESVRYLV